ALPIFCEIEPNGQPQPTKSESKKAAAEPPAQSTKATGQVKEMKVPAVGESITEVTISTWLKKDGDFVNTDEIIAEVESDKATFELPAEATGILRIVAQEKTTLPIGGLICRIEVVEGTVPTASKSQQEESGKPSAQETQNYAAGHP